MAMMHCVAKESSYGGHSVAWILLLFSQKRFLEIHLFSRTQLPVILTELLELQLDRRNVVILRLVQPRTQAPPLQKNREFPPIFLQGRSMGTRLDQYESVPVILCHSLRLITPVTPACIFMCKPITCQFILTHAYFGGCVGSTSLRLSHIISYTAPKVPSSQVVNSCR